MELELKKSERILLIKPMISSLDAAVSKDFRGKVFDLINQDNHFLLFNFSNVEFIDSNGLGSLISILKLLSKQNGRMVVCEVRDEVKKLFDLTRLNQVFDIFSTEQIALEDLTKKIQSLGTNERSYP